MAKKPWYRSKTIWFNIATAAVSTAAVIPAMVAEFGMSQEDAETLLKVALAVNIVGNFVLRSVTGQPIGRPE